jgi:hypothetical protein
MTARKGQSTTGLKPRELDAATRAVLEEGNVTAAARKLGIPRATLQHQLKIAVRAGYTVPRTQSNPSRWRPGAEIVAARKAEFERVRNSGPNRDGNVIFRPDDGPFMLIMLGDEHLDNPGTDLNLWERWIGYLNRAKHITGWSLGDVLDSWLKPLAHLYANSETPAPEGWILLQHYLDQIGSDLDCSVAGNHDKWAGANDVLGMLMEQHGVMHRADSLRVAYRCPNGREITVNARHTWPGRSMWNEVHSIKRAARMGIRDTILVGGHTHVSGESTERDPMNGKISFCYQVASFKLVDDYADTLGFLDRNLSPAVALVIDPRRADNDPELVKHFYDPAPAADYLAFLRRKAKAA